MSRKQARDIAFKVVYQYEFQKDENIEKIINDTIEGVSQEKEIKQAVLDYVFKVSIGIFEKNDDITQIIQNNLKKGWEIKRISKLNIAILKIAIFELLYLKDEIPPKVAINEALELIEKYGELNEKPFINGVLANVLKGENKE